jgi:hypothetical protein
MKTKNLSPIWMCLDKREKQAVLADLVQQLEHVLLSERIEAGRILLYILQVWICEITYNTSLFPGRICRF